MRLYDSLSRAVQEVVPVEEGHVKIYACGPTVYRYAHLGNLRTYMLSDLIRRALELEGYRVTLVMNITDVGHMTDESSPEAVDKMLLAVEDEGLQALEIAEKYTRSVLEDAEAVGIRPANVLPKATEHIPEMIELTERLIAKGHAYVVDTGSVYFDVTSFPGYGKLSGNTLENLKAGHRDLETDPRKRNAPDFALWKAAGEGRVMKWDSPWGEGFPGWHVECSAMSMKYLGERFDIHTGGTDLRFPHHEDEIAQSEAATGATFVRTWLHCAHLQLGGQKMAKRVGNLARPAELYERGVSPDALRYALMATHYRSPLDFSDESLTAATGAVERLRTVLLALQAYHGDAPDDPALRGVLTDARAAFADALADDLNISAALGAVFELVRDLNGRIADRTLSTADAGTAAAALLDLDQVLGVMARPADALPDALAALLQARAEARAARDWARSDELRARLAEAGVLVEDTPDGQRWRQGSVVGGRSR
jgi:cysteinyl-tRNA synthetase